MHADLADAIRRTDLCRPSEVGALLRRISHRPRRALGQHFLIDRHALACAAEAGELTPADGVLEVGAGLGVLTESLLERAGKVVAIEKDETLCEVLRERFAGEERFELIEGDALDCDLGGLSERCRKVAANLPYNVGNRVVVELLSCRSPPNLMILMVQRDVAHRLHATEGEKAWGLLSVLVQQRYRVELLRTVPPACFYPPPEVWSSLVCLRRHERPCDPADHPLFVRLVKCAFQERRKQTRSLWRRWPEPVGRNDPDRLLRDAGIDPAGRPETVPVSGWVRLADRLAGASD